MSGAQFAFRLRFLGVLARESYTAHSLSIGVATASAQLLLLLALPCKPRVGHGGLPVWLFGGSLLLLSLLYPFHVGAWKVMEVCSSRIWLSTYAHGRARRSQNRGWRSNSCKLEILSCHAQYHEEKTCIQPITHPTKPHSQCEGIYASDCEESPLD